MTAFLLCMFTDAIIIGGCTNIKAMEQWQHQEVGAKEVGVGAA